MDDRTSAQSPSLVRRALMFFDPGQDGFVERMLKLTAAAAIVVLCPLALLASISLETEIGRHFVVYVLTYSDMHRSALPRAEALVEDYPGGHWEYYRLLAINLRQLDRHEESLAVYDDAIAELPNEWWAHSHKCFYTALLTGDPSSVMDACDSSVQLVEAQQPIDLTDLGVAYDRRAFARALVGDLDGSLNDLETAIEYLDEDGWQGYEEDQRQARMEWLSALQSGENPITDDELRLERKHY